MRVRGWVRPGFFRGAVPILEGRGAGGGGILRIERQRHDLIGREIFHRQGGAVAEGMPAAHGDKGAGLDTRHRNACFQRPGLFLGFLQDGRAPADMTINLPRQRRPPPGNEPRQRRAHKPGREMIAGSENRLRRNGSTASGLSGPPRLNRTIAELHSTLPHKIILSKGNDEDVVCHVNLWRLCAQAGLE